MALQSPFQGKKRCSRIHTDILRLPTLSCFFCHIQLQLWEEANCSPATLSVPPPFKSVDTARTNSKFLLT